MATTLSTPASGHHPRVVPMHAVRIHAYGGPDALVYEAVPRPDPGPGELRVRVRAAGVNPVDWKVRAGYLAAYLPHRFPLTLGWDLSGVVDAVGPAVEHGAAGAPTGAAPFAVGDAIVARSEITRDGAYAEYAIVRSDEATPKPSRPSAARRVLPRPATSPLPWSSSAAPAMRASCCPFRTPDWLAERAYALQPS